MSLRTPETEDNYRRAREFGTLKPLGAEPKLDGAPSFTHWRVIENRFPHDRHHVRNHLVVLKRRCQPGEITPSELYELWYDVTLWAETQKYDYVKFNLPSVRSVVDTPHLHLLELKPEYK